MTLNFNKYATDGTRFLKELAVELGDSENTDRAGRVLRSVLHAIRNRLTNEESVQMLAQLPMFLKAVYVEKWTLKRAPLRINNLGDFYNEIRELNNHSSNHDFITDDEMKHALSAVLSALKKYVSPGELEDIQSVLPKALKPLLD